MLDFVVNSDAIDIAIEFDSAFLNDQDVSLLASQWRNHFISALS